MGNITLQSTAGGSTSLQSDSTQTQDLNYTLFSNDIESRILSGAELTAVGIVGANPAATLWANGDITGSSDNGSFTKYSNGDLECSFLNTVSTVTSGAVGGLFFGDTSLNYPLPFIGEFPLVAYTEDHINQLTWSTSQNASESLAQCKHRLIGTAISASAYVGYITKGRWK